MAKPITLSHQVRSGGWESMISANGGLPAHRYTPQVTPRWPRGSEPASPILYGFWHAYKFCITQTFRSFWPIVIFFRKGLLRSVDTVPCFPKLITMEITVGALLLGMGPHIRRLNRKCHSLGLARPVNRARTPTLRCFGTRGGACDTQAPRNPSTKNVHACLGNGIRQEVR